MWLLSGGITICIVFRGKIMCKNTRCHPATYRGHIMTAQVFTHPAFINNYLLPALIAFPREHSHGAGGQTARKAQDGQAGNVARISEAGISLVWFYELYSDMALRWRERPAGVINHAHSNHNKSVPFGVRAMFDLLIVIARENSACGGDMGARRWFNCAKVIDRVHLVDDSRE